MGTKFEKVDGERSSEKVRYKIGGKVRERNGGKVGIDLAKIDHTDKIGHPI